MGKSCKKKKQLVRADTTAIIFALKARNPDIWDRLSVARLKQSENNDDLNREILKELGRYTPNAEKKKEKEREDNDKA